MAVETGDLAGEKGRGQGVGLLHGSGVVYQETEREGTVKEVRKSDETGFRIGKGKDEESG